MNRGISGQITGEMLGRMKADVIDLKPAAMLVLAGTNDIARGVPLSAIENNLTMIADLADLYKIKPMFASVLPISDYHKDVNPRYEMSKARPPSAIIELNRWLEAFCKQRHYPYVDYFSKMVDPSGYMKADLADDGLHPNSAGLSRDGSDRAGDDRPSCRPVRRLRRRPAVSGDRPQQEDGFAGSHSKARAGRDCADGPNARSRATQAHSIQGKGAEARAVETVQADPVPAAAPPKPTPSKVKESASEARAGRSPHGAGADASAR